MDTGEVPITIIRNRNRMELRATLEPRPTATDTPEVFEFDFSTPELELNDSNLDLDDFKLELPQLPPLKIEKFESPLLYKNIIRPFINLGMII